MKRRRNIFVLLFVLAPDRGLRTRHRQQADAARARPEGRRAARPAGAADAAAADDRQRLDGKGGGHHPLGLRPARRLGDRSRAGRQRPDPGRHPRRDQRRPGDRMRDQARPPLFLRLGTEPDRPREGDRRHAGAGTAESGARRSGKGMERRRPQPLETGKRPAGRRRGLCQRVQRGEARRRTEAGPGLRKLQPADDLLPVPEGAAAQADLRAGVQQGRPLHRPQREEAATRRRRGREGAAGDDPDLREAQRQQGPDDRRRAARLVRVQGRPGALGDRNQQPEGRTAGIRPGGHLPVQRRRPPGLPGSHPPDRPARPGAGDRAGLGRTGRTALRPLRRGARQRSQNDGRSSTSPKTPTGSTAAPGRRSPAASTAYPTPRTWPPTCSAARCRSTST